MIKYINNGFSTTAHNGNFILFKQLERNGDQIITHINSKQWEYNQDCSIEYNIRCWSFNQSWRSHHIDQVAQHCNQNTVANVTDIVALATQTSMADEKSWPDFTQTSPHWHWCSPVLDNHFGFLPIKHKWWFNSHIFDWHKFIPFSFFFQGKHFVEGRTDLVWQLHRLCFWTSVLMTWNMVRELLTIKHYTW